MKRVLVIGAGVAGLSSARRLVRSGIEVVVLEKSRGLGGRCATWRVQDQPVDYGAGFYHGSHPEFLAALRAVPDVKRLEGWPLRVAGEGTPCQPGAFARGESRLAFAEGMTVFPKYLAADLEVRRETRATALREREGGVEIETADGATLHADALILATPSPQARDLLQTLSAGTGADPGLMTLHDGIATTRCLTLLAGYPPEPGRPHWDVLHPEGSRILQTLLHDSAKRDAPRWTALALQAHSAWSREWFDRPEADWTTALLDEAGRLCGEWIRRPAWVKAHRWKHARVTGDSLLSRPLVLRLPGGAPIGLTGDAFGLSGGTEAAWLAGRNVAELLLSP